MANNLSILFKKELEKDIRAYLEDFKKELIKELVDQGHKGGGRLIGSIEPVVKATNNLIEAGIVLFDYYKYLDQGVSAQNIPYTRGSGAGKSRYIQGLIFHWLRLGLSAKEAKRAAFATAMKHKREGMPTRRSYAFSNNGRRLGFFRVVFERKIVELEEILQRSVENSFSVSIESFLDNIFARFEAA